jgi:hypothetical protein
LITEAAGNRKKKKVDMDKKEEKEKKAVNMPNYTTTEAYVMASHSDASDARRAAETLLRKRYVYSHNDPSVSPRTSSQERNCNKDSDDSVTIPEVHNNRYIMQTNVHNATVHAIPNRIRFTGTCISRVEPPRKPRTATRTATPPVRRSAPISPRSPTSR